jgi:PAS domain S-box-containing protein
MKKIKSPFLLISGILFFIILAIFFNYQVFKWIQNGEIQNWQLFSQNVVAGLNPGRVAEMQGKPSDKNLENYTYLRNQLIRTMDIGEKKKIKWVYLMTVKDDKILFTVDSIPDGEFGHSEPGDEYINYPKEILESHNKKEIKVANSYSDEWGSFFSVFTPISDWNTSEVIGILGVDIARLDYNYAIVQKMLWSLIITVFIFFLLLLFIKQFKNQITLKENDALFKIITEGSLDSIVITNKLGKIVLWNKAAEEMFAFTKKEALDNELLNMIVPQDESNDIKVKKLLDLFQVGKSLNKNEIIEFKVNDKNKKEFDAEISISAVKLNSEWHVISVIRDISEKKKKNDELLIKNKEIADQSKAILNILDDVNEEKENAKKHADELRKFEAAVNQSNEMMVFSDKEGIILWGNPAVEKMTGFSLDEFLGKKAGLLWGRLMTQEWYAKLWHRIKIEKKIFVDTITNHRKNGEKFISNITIYPLPDNNGESNIFVSTQRDVTKEIEVDRMKTDFISLASHQLRTPLSGIKWFLEMLLEGDMGKLNKEQQDAIENIDKSNERMIALVSALLNISRIESGRIIIESASVNLLSLAQSVVDELKIKFENKKQKLILSVDKNLPDINLDQKLIRQVFLNLLTNANKYTPENGEIIIFISKKEEEVLVQVSDDGSGIPEQEQRKIFEKFFRATNALKQETDGTGLGLYLVKAIVESSEGKIWFKSKVDSGTSFWFTLPLKGVKAKKGEVSIE